MSDDDRHRILGKAVEAYGASKSETAALRHRAEEIRGQLSDIDQYLNEFGSGKDFPPNEARKVLSELSKEEVASLIDDIETLKAKQKKLRQTWKDAGIEPKD